MPDVLPTVTDSQTAGGTQFRQITPPPPLDDSWTSPFRAGSRLELAQAEEQARQDARLQQQLAQNARVADAYKAVEAARRHIGMANYGRDLAAMLAAGVPAEEAHAHALSRHAADLFSSNPAAFAKAMTPTPVPRVVSDQGQQAWVSGGHVTRIPSADLPFTPSNVSTPVTTPEGETIGQSVQVGRGSRRVLPAASKADPQKTQALSLLVKEKSRLESEIGQPPGDPQAAEGWRKLHRGKVERLAEVNQRIGELNPYVGGQGAAPTPAATPAAQPAGKPVRLRRKSDGRTFTYGGNAADVPAEYEVLP